MNVPGSVLLASSSSGQKHDAMYYLKGAAAGGICCSITHAALTPVDVVKTRVQLDSAKVSTNRTFFDWRRTSYGFYTGEKMHWKKNTNAVKTTDIAFYHH